MINVAARPENNSRVRISWTTTFELNNSHFEIQRSANGSNFTTVASVKSKGNSNGLVDYFVNDEQPLSGTSYYGIKQVDIDGRSTNTRIVSVNMEDAAGVDVYPNPLRENKFTIRFRSAIQGKINVQVFDMSGRMHLSKQENVVSGRLQVDHRLAPGSYVVHITGRTVNEKKLIIISN
jgi:hypothetical protein